MNKVLTVIANWDGYVCCYYGEVLIDGESRHRTGYADTVDEARELGFEWCKHNDEASKLLEEA